MMELLKYPFDAKQLFRKKLALKRELVVTYMGSAMKVRAEGMKLLYQCYYVNKL